MSLEQLKPSQKARCRRHKENRMESNLITAAIIMLIWILNGKCIVYGIKKNVYGEVYHHTGIGIFLTLIVIEKLFKKTDMFFDFDILWLKIIGYVLFIPSVIFIFGSFYQLKIKNKADSLGPQGTKRLVDTGVFGIVRHPMWIGFSLWSFALILCFQSLISFVLGTISIICFRIASAKEDGEGVKAFGDEYSEYMKKVPMWNFVKGLGI